MSFTGKNPSFKWLTLEPQAADPTSPNEGDIFRSDGTPRDEGLWVYEGATWVQVSTGASLSTLTNLTLTPQSSDPGSPAEGMIFRADGTSRTEGIWEYINGGWNQVTGLRYQEFSLANPFTVIAATTVNNPLSSGVYQAGGTLDGTVLIAGDLILIKDQTTASENGVYTVNTGVAPTRHASYDTFSELNNAVVYVKVNSSNTPTNKNTLWYQTATLTSLSDNQTWASTPLSKTFVVPYGTHEVEVFACGGGAGAGAGEALGMGGGGGGGGIWGTYKFKVTPNETLTIALARHALGGISTLSSTGANGTAGYDTTVSGTSGTITFYGGGFGSGGGLAPGHGGDSKFAVGGYGNNGGAGGGGFLNPTGSRYEASGLIKSVNGSNYTNGQPAGIGGGGAGESGNPGNSGGSSPFVTTTSTGGAETTSGRGGGGGGGNSIGAGGNGGAGQNSVQNDGGYGVNGGGGGGGGARQSGRAGTGGIGGAGYVRLSWS